MSRQDFHVAPDNKTTIVGSSEALERVIAVATQRRSLAVRSRLRAAANLTGPSKTSRQSRVSGAGGACSKFRVSQRNCTDL